MALFSQNMLELAIELAAHDRTYEDMVTKFVEHFFYIAAAMNRSGSGRHVGRRGRLLLRPAAAPRRKRHTGSRCARWWDSCPCAPRRLIGEVAAGECPADDRWAHEERLRRMPELKETIHPTGPGHFGVAERGILALVNPERLRRILTKMLDENEFLSPYGIRSLSKFHEKHPYIFHVDGQEYRVDYLPAESNTGMFGGNSNWRGPIWMPVNALILRALQNFYLYYGDNFKIECPTGSGKMMNLFEVSQGDRRSAHPDLTARRARPAARLWRRGEIPERSTLARLHPLLRILPRRQWRRTGRQPSDRVDGTRGQDRSSFTVCWIPSDSWKGARRAVFKESGQQKKR